MASILQYIQKVFRIYDLTPFNVIGIGARRMKKQDLDHCKMLLNDQLEALLDYAGHTVQGLLDVTDNMPDPLDRASFCLRTESGIHHEFKHQ